MFKRVNIATGLLCFLWLRCSLWLTNHLHGDPTNLIILLKLKKDGPYLLQILWPLSRNKRHTKIPYWWCNSMAIVPGSDKHYCAHGSHGESAFRIQASSANIGGTNITSSTSCYAWTWSFHEESELTKIASYLSNVNWELKENDRHVGHGEVSSITCRWSLWWNVVVKVQMTVIHQVWQNRESDRSYYYFLDRVQIYRFEW